MAFIVSMRLSLVLGMAFLEKPTIMERFVQLIPLRHPFAALAWTIEEACETECRTTFIERLEMHMKVLGIVWAGVKTRRFESHNHDSAQKKEPPAGLRT